MKTIQDDTITNDITRERQSESAVLPEREDHALLFLLVPAAQGGHHLIAWTISVEAAISTPTAIHYLYSDYTFCLHLLSRPYTCVYISDVGVDYLRLFFNF